MLRFSFMYAVMAVYITINAYLFFRLSSVLSGTGMIRTASCALFCLIVLIFPLSRFAYAHLPEWASSIMIKAGSIYLAVMAYAFISTLLADIIGLIDSYAALFIIPRKFALACVLVLTSIVCVCGAINSRFPCVVRHDITSDTVGSRRIKIGVMSDLHFGRMVGTDLLERAIALLNAEAPDLILLPGDMIDDLSWVDDPSVRDRFIELFSSLSPRLGTWATLGNHELYAGADEASEMLSRSGVRVLRDGWIESGKDVIMIGREDRASSLYGYERRSLDAMVSEIRESGSFTARDLPIIVIDHQPIELDEASRSRVSLQVSGHTHRGQMWPVDLIVARMFECSYGLYKKDDTFFYVSSGVGTWGPPVRTTGCPEVVIIEMNI